MIHHKPKVVDLCCGAGGFSEGFRQAGFDIILGVDIWKVSLQSFKLNHKCDVIKKDIRFIESLPECDVIIGSPPCQNLSKISRTKNDTKGLELIHEFERIVKENNPDYWVWENVDYIKKYYPSASILNSWDFGLPQRRIRAFVSNFTTFRMNYSPGKWTKPYQYSGARADNKSRACAKHITRSGTVRTKRIRDLETGEYLPIQDVKILMGFPGEYILSGSTTNQQKQLGNAVCPPISKAIAEGIMNDIND